MTSDLQNSATITTFGDFTPWPEALQSAYIAAGYWTKDPLTKILEDQAHAQPNKVALIGPDHTLTFAAFNQAAERLAHALRAKGLCPNDNAVVQLPNGALFYVVFFALLKLGVKPVGALFSHGIHELQSFHAQLSPRLVVASRAHKLFRNDQDAADAMKRLNHEGIALFDTGSDDCLTNLAFRDAPITDAGKLPNLNAEDIAFYQLSGGSTNIPKLIPRTHADYYYSIRQSCDVCELTPLDTYLCALPAPHNFPMSSPGALGIWHAGGTVVMASDPSPQTCFTLIKNHEVTVTSLVPPLLPLWLDAAKDHRAEIASLRFVQVGGAKLPPAIAARIEPELGCLLQQVFGMAEGLVCYTRLHDDQWTRCNTQGLPMSPADEIKIINEDGHPVADGESGLLKTRGPYTIRGYFRAPEHNLRVFDADGFYTTGDIVCRLSSGHLIVTGRDKDQINRGGEKIAPEEVENLLLKYEGIIQAAVVAMPDDTLGERSCAFLVCEGDSPKPHLIRRHLREYGIADFKLPDRFITLDSLPLTAVGKPDKKHLRQTLVEEPNP